MHSFLPGLLRGVRRESFAERQLRLQLETLCSRQFERLASGPLRAYLFTLLMFDFGESGNVAFKTCLDRSALIETFEALLASWKEKRLRVGFGPPGILPGLDEIKAAGESIERSEAVGYALLVGAGELSSYIAVGERAGVAEMIEKTLLPAWRAS